MAALVAQTCAHAHLQEHWGLPITACKRTLIFLKVEIKSKTTLELTTVHWNQWHQMNMLSSAELQRETFVRVHNGR